VRKSLLLIGWCAFLALALPHSRLKSAASLSVTGQSAIGAAADSPTEPSLNARITRIENGLLPPVVIKGQSNPTTNIAERMAHYKVPGMSVAFFDRGQIVWTRTYGFADVASKRPITPETLFQAASISKPVSALAALRLVQEGKIRLDDDVNSYLRSWRVPENQFTKEQKVTLRRILSHSAGLTIHGFPGYAPGEPVPTILQILNGEKPANTKPIRVDTVPGTIWRYSGGGYIVMQLLLPEITGKPFPQILHDLVLQPAGMTDSTYEQPLPKNLSALAASPYRANGEPVKGGWHSYPEMAAAALWTTPSDLARLAIEVQEEYTGKSGKILSQEMMRQMLTPQVGNQGLAFVLSLPGHTLRFGHSGANAGFRCDLDAYAYSGQGIAIMTNSDSGDSLTGEYLGAVAKEYNWPDFQPIERTLAKIDPVALLNYAGVYEAAGLGKVTVTAKEGKLYLQVAPFGPEPIELLPESDTSFFSLSHGINLPFVFKKDEKGAVSQLTIIAGGTYEAKKVK